MVNLRFQKNIFEYLFIKMLEVLPHCHFETWHQNISKLYIRKWLVIFKVFENNFIRSPLCREYSYNSYFEINDISLGDISNYCHTSEFFGMIYLISLTTVLISAYLIVT